MAREHSFSQPRIFYGPQRQMHYLSKPHGFASGMAEGNLGYQMAYSVKLLENQLAKEERYFVLQLNMDRIEDDWENPTWWRLYANGLEVARGSGEFARECFYDSAEKFMTQCHEVISDSGVEPLCEHDYKLLKTAQHIAAVEPFHDGSHIMGARQCRVF